jgi:hypothetical protein
VLRGAFPWVVGPYAGIGEAIERGVRLISRCISARVLGLAMRKAISQMTWCPSSPQAQASLIPTGKTAENKTAASRRFIWSPRRPMVTSHGPCSLSRVTFRPASITFNGPWNSRPNGQQPNAAHSQRHSSKGLKKRRQHGFASNVSFHLAFFGLSPRRQRRETWPHARRPRIRSASPSGPRCWPL